MKKLTLIALITLVLMDVVVSIFSTTLASSPISNHPSYSSRESKSRGAFIGALALTPTVMHWKGKRIIIREAWIERQMELVQIYTIIPFIFEHRRYRTVSGLNLCFTLDEGWDALWSPTNAFFVLEGQGKSFGVRGSVVLWDNLDEIPNFPQKLVLTDNWKLDGRQAIEIRMLHP